MTYIEWGISYWRYPEDIHCGPMSLAEAEEWLAEWEADGGRPGAFIMVSRLVGEWGGSSTASEPQNPVASLRSRDSQRS